MLALKFKLDFQLLHLGWIIRLAAVLESCKLLDLFFNFEKTGIFCHSKILKFYDFLFPTFLEFRENSWKSGNFLNFEKTGIMENLGSFYILRKLLKSRKNLGIFLISEKTPGRTCVFFIFLENS